MKEMMTSMHHHMGTVRQRIGAVFKRRAAAAAPSYKLLNPAFGELFDDDDDFDFNAPNNKNASNIFHTQVKQKLGYRQRIGNAFNRFKEKRASTSAAAAAAADTSQTPLLP